MITLLVLLVILYSLTISFVKRVSYLGTRQAQVGEDVAFSESLGIELNIYRAEVALFKNHLVFHSPNPSQILGEIGPPSRNTILMPEALQLDIRRISET